MVSRVSDVHTLGSESDRCHLEAMTRANPGHPRSYRDLDYWHGPQWPQDPSAFARTTQLSESGPQPETVGTTFLQNQSHRKSPY